MVLGRLVSVSVSKDTKTQQQQQNITIRPAHASRPSLSLSLTFLAAQQTQMLASLSSVQLRRAQLLWGRAEPPS